MGRLIQDQDSNSGNRYPGISAQCLKFAHFFRPKDFILINVHIPYYGEIAKTDLLVPYNEIERHIKDLPADKDAKIVVYCMMGPMGDIAAEKLASMDTRG